MSEYEVVWSGTRNGREAGTFGLASSEIQTREPLLQYYAPQQSNLTHNRGHVRELARKRRTWAGARVQCPCGRLMKHTSKRCKVCLDAGRSSRRRAA
jgi:hypothetical protein